MASNHKLTALLKGRIITGTESQGNELRIGFDDGSTMIVQIGGSMSSASTGGTINAVRQEGTNLNQDFQTGGSMKIQTAEPTASVMVRDRDHKLEYAD